MTSLELLDPTRADDPRFDPDGHHAERVRSAALARAASTPRRTAPRPRGRTAVAGLVTACAVAAGVVVAVTATDAPDARASLVAAAERTDGFESGRVVLTERFHDPDGRVRGHDRSEVRFDGTDLELVTRSVVELPDRKIERRVTVRQFDGVAYERDDTRPSAGFRRVGRVAPTSFHSQLARYAGGEGLLRLARAADDVVEQAGPNGTTFRATATVAEIEAAAPTSAGVLPGPASRRPVALRVDVTGDGRVRRVVTEQPGLRREIEYLDLGVAQPIERP